MVHPLFSAALAVVAGAAQPEPASPIVVEAQRFMDDYARDLRAGDRAAIAARYSRSGAFSLGHAPKRYESFGAIEASYAGPGWQKPHSFAWQGLSFEDLGPDAVVVVGNLLWSASAGGEPALIAYTALLRREDGRLRIRVEHENPVSQRETPKAP